MNRTDLQQLAETRLREAEILLNAGEPSGAYYLAGYAVECGLKACIAKQTNLHDFPEKERAIRSYSHNVANLVKEAGLKPQHDAEIRINPAFHAFWLRISKGWDETSRYELWSQAEAMDLIDAVNDQTNGVLQWIKRHW